MRGFAGRIFRGQGHNVLDDRRRVERLAAGRAGFVAQQPAEALAHEPLLPAPHDGFGAPSSAHDAVTRPAAVTNYASTAEPSPTPTFFGASLERNCLGSSQRSMLQP